MSLYINILNAILDEKVFLFGFNFFLGGVGPDSRVQKRYVWGHATVLEKWSLSDFNKQHKFILRHP